MVRIGIVGIGFMGMIHTLAARKLARAKVIAICSRDRAKREGDWRNIRGNFGPPGEVMDLTGVASYERLEDLLADPSIDLIDICNPTHNHPATAIAALKAGKHVLCEKAIALTVAEADAMLGAARASGRLLMVAHVLPFFSDFAYAADILRDGRFGKLLAGHFRRIISRPDWSADIGDAAQTGGPAIDLHIHDAHFIRLTFGMPQSVSSSGTSGGGTVQQLTTAYRYANGPAITCTSGALAMKGRPFVHGYELFFERATVHYESGAIPLTIYHGDGSVEKPELAGADPVDSFAIEIQAAVDGVISGKIPAPLDGQSARDALALCLAEVESAQTGRIVELK